MKFILLSAFLLSCVVQAGAQDKRILDSLEQVLGTKEGLDRYEALHKLAVQYVDVDDERALSISNEAECVALNSLDTFSIVKSKRLKGQILLRLGRNEEVISTCESVLPFGHEGRYSEEWVLILNNFGIAYLYESRFDKALEYLFAGYEIAGTENNPSWRAMSLNNIGITYYKLRDYDRALDFFLRAYDVKKSLGLISLYEPINICLCYVQIGDFGNA
ncbi:MAG TPA: tetratricopeptide repeat protein, partial [Chryseosolibacter sp.]